jgi:hypothetical protein
MLVATLMWSVVLVPVMYSGFKDSVKTLIIERCPVPPLVIEGYPSILTGVTGDK